jgi:HAMP domain-containing protein
MMSDERGVVWMVVARTFVSVAILLALWLQTLANGRAIESLRMELSAALEQVEAPQ